MGPYDASQRLRGVPGILGFVATGLGRCALVRILAPTATLRSRPRRSQCGGPRVRGARVREPALRRGAVRCGPSATPSSATRPARATGRSAASRTAGEPPTAARLSAPPSHSDPRECEGAEWDPPHACDGAQPSFAPLAAVVRWIPLGFGTLRQVPPALEARSAGCPTATFCCTPRVGIVGCREQKSSFPDSNRPPSASKSDVLPTEPTLLMLTEPRFSFRSGPATTVPTPGGHDSHPRLRGRPGVFA